MQQQLTEITYTSHTNVTNIYLLREKEVREKRLKRERERVRVREREEEREGGREGA